VHHLLHRKLFLRSLSKSQTVLGENRVETLVPSGTRPLPPQMCPTLERVQTLTGCPGKWWSHHPWRCSKNVYMWHFRTWFSRHSGVRLTVGLDDLGGLLQP